MGFVWMHLKVLLDKDHILNIKLQFRKHGLAAGQAYVILETNLKKYRSQK